MEKIVKQYLEGDIVARDYLLDSIKRIHDNTINKHEAMILLYKRYGKPKII